MWNTRYIFIVVFNFLLPDIGSKIELLFLDGAKFHKRNVRNMAYYSVLLLGPVSNFLDSQ
jgi:hypothetical protein